MSVLFLVQGEYTCKKKLKKTQHCNWHVQILFSTAVLQTLVYQVYIRLFSRLPHLMRFLSLDVLLKKLYETHYQIIHTFCYLWLEL